ncbi:MAG TPA: LuxR family transcriptional regulator [Micromonosporaceae bacterium]|nr:LuxR family transcriptional regulator [Micromonosporaceae bacterium]
MTDAPRYVLDSTAAATVVLRHLTRGGWTTRDGFALPESTWDVAPARLALFGRVSAPDTAELAVLAAARGAGIVAVADISTELGRALLADLSRIGAVRTEPDRTEQSAAAGPQRRLAVEHRALLDRLANGETIAASATAEFLSLRTANRRIAEAREILGVRTTREAVLAYLRLPRDGP